MRVAPASSAAAAAAAAGGAGAGAGAGAAAAVTVVAADTPAAFCAHSQCHKGLRRHFALYIQGWEGPLTYCMLMRKRLLRYYLEVAGANKMPKKNNII